MMTVVIMAAMVAGGTVGCTKYYSNNDNSDNGSDDYTVGKDTGDVNLLGDNKLTDLLKTGVGGSLSLKGKPERNWLKLMFMF